MASVENLVAELKALTPDQLERVAQIVHELSAESRPPEHASPSVVSNSVLEQAIQNGWPPTLFTDVIGHIDEDFEKPPQLPYEIRPAL
ncbi:MAG: hypothetical protein ACR2NN_28675 [Bryobacteraceae bacterium]